MNIKQTINKLQKAPIQRGKDMEMREILFRAKHIHALPQNEHLDRTWVYGYLCDENYINSPELEGEFLVDPSTVCQYTGLTDKNGRKIFEGDIINDIDYGIMKCIYLHGSFMWYKEDGFRIECMKYKTGEEQFKNNPNLYIPRKLYFLINPQSCLFRSSHVKKLKER